MPIKKKHESTKNRSNPKPTEKHLNIFLRSLKCSFFAWVLFCFLCEHYWLTQNLVQF